MARRNEKCSKEMKEQTAAFILETGKSATKTAKEMRIDVNTVCHGNIRTRSVKLSNYGVYTGV